ncbi:hypothetical protein BGW36DRAFT_291187 [Talaromyces proteolyticus]|uniref:C2H2-type domain-containing protein n=1 Tax=Talaromyces proteolyticus TaxID=1131652 RepID=A0AAD4KZI4_9EURO|nr:uncharacterized protein BGW36DRAFT_291187 [Talaromyces proteolyticus]KAH8700139.1 hypothetical protein BGW36DRAFT_291187 [Talaromyces proteolyticus]
MPDLGKFPALRRRRKDKREDQQTPNKESSTTSVTQVNVNSMLNQPSDQPQHYTSDKLAAQDATWPAATQQKLAQAASEYLSKDPTNDKGQCSSDSLMLLLRNNPTYPDLCAQLESRGFVLDRQALARSLLAAVPALISNNTASQEPKNGEANGSLTSQQVQNSDPGAIESMALQATKPAPSSAEKAASKPQPKKNPAHPKSPRIENMPQLSTADVLFLDANGGSASMSIADLGTNASALPKNKPASLRKSLAQPIPPPVLGPKQEKARKRLFSEIVDLSLLSSDEDDEADEQEELSDEETGSRLSKQARIDHASIEHGGSSGFDQPSIDIGAPSPRPFESERSKSPTDSHMDEPEIDFNPDDEFCIRSIKAFKKIAKPIEPSAALERVYYNPKSVARDILITAGRHPSERPLNYHLIKFPDIFAGIGSKTDLGTFRWDLVDPGGPAMPVVELEDILAEPPRVPRKRRRDRQSRENTDKEGPASDAPHTELGPDSLSVTTTPLVRKTMTGTPTSGPGSGRRGRPPGSKNKNPTKATLKAAARSAQVAAPARLPIPDAPYPIFTCEWATCPAQLHDVHTLERHVDKAHVPGQTRCQWSRCPNSDTEYDGEDLKKHLHQAHVQALAWKYGDGPSVNGTDIQLDRYLNANGSIITPDANKAGESDSLIFPVEPTPIRAFNKLRGNDMPTQKAQEVLLAVRRRRKQVGIGLEQQGCEFSNPTRNKVFVNDEEVYQVVTDDEEDADDWFQQGDSS